MIVSILATLVAIAHMIVTAAIVVGIPVLQGIAILWLPIGVTGGMVFIGDGIMHYNDIDIWIGGIILSSVIVDIYLILIFMGGWVFTW